MKTFLKHFFFIGGAISMIILSQSYFFNTDVGLLRNKDYSQYAWYLLVFRIHIFTGLVSILSGAIQLIEYLRIRYPDIHRALGRIYVCCVFASSICGLLVAPLSLGGAITSAGFSFLALIWFYFTLLAFRTAIHGKIKEHWKWVLRSYALTFSSITFRSMLLVSLLAPIEFELTYQVSSWACWILNLAIVEGYFHFPKFLKYFCLVLTPTS